MARKCAIILGCAILLLAGTAFAKPNSGVGIYAGLSSTSVTDPALSGTLHGTGAGIGFDYQAVLGDNFSINPNVLVVHETGDDLVAFDPFFGTIFFSTELDYTIIGVNALFWPTDTFYVGAGLANHNIKLTLTEKTTQIGASTSNSGTGPSLAVGFEASNGLFFSARYDSVSIDSDDFSSVRVLIGYRFH